MNAGYAVLAPNPRGSTGYAKPWREANRGDWGGRDLEDVAKGAEWLEQQHLADGRRIGAYGGSYGGYLTLMSLALRPDRFAAGVSVVGVVSWKTMFETTRGDLREYLLRELGDPTKDAERYRDRSPITHAAKIRAPLLILQGANDPRVPRAEAEQVVKALRETGKMHEYHVYEGGAWLPRDREPRRLSAPRARLVRPAPAPRLADRMSPDAVVVGAGPNGLSAAIALAREGLSVSVLEANDTIGGGCRSAALTLPGFLHDVCSAFHPMGAASPFFRALDLGREGLEWIEPPAALAHPLDDGTAVLLERSIDATASGLGADGRMYRRLVEPLSRAWDELAADALGPLLRIPRHPFLLARLGIPGILPARVLARLFRSPRTRALLAGLAAHSALPLDAPLTGSFALMFAVTTHVANWPIPRGGSQRIADALAARLQSLGGAVVTGQRVGDIGELPAAKAILFDVTPLQLDRIAGSRLDSGYRDQLRAYRYGPGVFKVDYAIDGPIPWRAADCLRAGTVHLGGTMDEIAESEAIRPRRPAEPLRSDARARRQAHRVGLLPRPERVDGGHGAAHRCAARALRPRLSRSRPRAKRHEPGRHRAEERELHRR